MSTRMRNNFNTSYYMFLKLFTMSINVSKKREINLSLFAHYASEIKLGN